MADDLLLAQYPKQQVVRDRNSSGLLDWAAGVVAEPIPPDKPDEDWVRKRLVAERIPIQPDNYVQRTLAFFQQHEIVQVNIRQFLSQWNDEATEVSLSAQNAAIISDFIARFAAVDVSDADVAAWYEANGFVDPVSV
jgi:hypothetical protein